MTFCRRLSRRFFPQFIKNPFLFDTLPFFTRRKLLIMVLNDGQKTHLNVFRMDMSWNKRTYRCRSTLSWTFVIAGDTFWLVRHQIRQAFLVLGTLIAVCSLCKRTLKLNKSCIKRFDGQELSLIEVKAVMRQRDKIGDGWRLKLSFERLKFDS